MRRYNPGQLFLWCAANTLDPSLSSIPDDNEEKTARNLNKEIKVLNNILKLLETNTPIDKILESIDMTRKDRKN